MSFTEQLAKIIYKLSIKPTHASGPKRPTLSQQESGIKTKAPN